MTTTPTLRDAAQALLSAYMFSPVAAEDAALHKAVDALRAALAAPADALVEPVAHLWRNVIDGRTRVVMPDSIITADASWVVEDSLHTATQLQQAVARAYEECAAICEAVAVRWGHHQVAPSAAHNCAQAIRQKGQP